MDTDMDTARWLDALDEAPDELRELLRGLALDTAPPSESAAAEQLSRILHGVASEVARPELAGAWAARQVAPPVRPGLGWLGKFVGFASLIGSAALGWSLLHSAGAPNVSTPAAPRRSPTLQIVVPLPPPSAASLPAVPALPAPPPPAASKVDKPHRPAALTRPSDPGAEVELLERAQRTMKADPKAALALLAEHERSFPRGDLVQEREMLAIEALQATGQLRAARKRANDFLRRFPHSSHIPRLELLLHATPR
jgi:hypothetical protein